MRINIGKWKNVSIGHRLPSNQLKLAGGITPGQKTSGRVVHRTQVT